MGDGLLSLDGADSVARALVTLFERDDEDALDVIQRWEGHRRPAEVARRYVRLALGRPETPVALPESLSLEEARLVVARSREFPSWQALRHAVHAAAGRPMLSRPVRVTSTTGTDDDPRTSRRTRHWDEALTWLADPPMTALHAAGQMTDDTFDRVSRLSHLQSLCLDDSRALTSAGLRTLGRLDALRHLSLAGCPGVDDASLAVLRSLPDLETLSLAWTQVSDLGLAALAECRRLRVVNLMGTPSGDGALRALAGHAHLRTLSTGNAVTVEGLRALHDVPAFARWQDEAPQMGLLDFTAGPTYLLARGPFGAAGLEAIGGLHGLYALNVDDPELGLTGEALVPLRDHPHLGWLAFDARDDAMPHIAAMPKLRFLMCQDTPASDRGFTALSRSASLEYLWGRRCHGLGRRGFEALSTMPALRALSVSCRSVDDEGLAALPRFPALRELMPMDVTDAGYRHIGACERLESLVLMYCRDTGDEATSHIHGLPGLRRYFASYTRITDRTTEWLAQSTSLEHVTLDTCVQVTSRGIAALAAAPRLRRVDVAGMPRVDAGIASAFPAGVDVRYHV